MTRTRIRTLVTSLTIVIGVGCQTDDPQQPNIIYILADDLGYGEVGAYGQQKIKTPSLDMLAMQGMMFTQHYSGSPVCAPSRATLMSGKHTGHTLIRDNYELGGFTDDEENGQMPLPPGSFTIGRMLQQKGYVTAAIGKWGLGGPGSTGVPNKQGFDFFYGYLDQKQAHNYYPTHLWRNEVWDSLANPYFSPHQRFEGDPTDPAAYDVYKGKDYAQDLMASEALEFYPRASVGTVFPLFTIPGAASGTASARLRVEHVRRSVGRNAISRRQKLSTASTSQSCVRSDDH